MEATHEQGGASLDKAPLQNLTYDLDAASVEQGELLVFCGRTQPDTRRCHTCVLRVDEPSLARAVDVFTLIIGDCLIVYADSRRSCRWYVRHRGSYPIFFQNVSAGLL